MATLESFDDIVVDLDSDDVDADDDVDLLNPRDLDYVVQYLGKNRLGQVCERGITSAPGTIAEHLAHLRTSTTSTHLHARDLGLSETRSRRVNYKSTGRGLHDIKGAPAERPATGFFSNIK
ncbi:hypothetical protein HDU90_009191 [Geranomyces variabilis]|nr:hypothetical protein HDU90_009191 [Geranomyces variabilis]